MKVSNEIIEASKPYETGPKLEFLCPHCHTDLDVQYDDQELECLGNNGIRTQKDPCFCESSSATTVYWKCPKCGGIISEYISWDN